MFACFKFFGHGVSFVTFRTSDCKPSGNPSRTIVISSGASVPILTWLPFTFSAVISICSAARGLNDEGFARAAGQDEYGGLLAIFPLTPYLRESLGDTHVCVILLQAV